MSEQQEEAVKELAELIQRLSRVLDAEMELPDETEEEK